MAKIYTKSGDKGETSLVGGQRFMKSNPRIDAYGDIDELNSFLGLLISQVGISDHKLFLSNLQSVLFTIGSNVACLPQDREKLKLPALREESLQILETEIDRIEAGLVEIKNFIMPGGTTSASYAHICRTVCRRAERKIISLEDDTIVFLHSYINRLSDYFFVLARSFNSISGCEEELWLVDS